MSVRESRTQSPTVQLVNQVNLVSGSGNGFNPSAIGAAHFVHAAINPSVEHAVHGANLDLLAGNDERCSVRINKWLMGLNINDAPGFHRNQSCLTHNIILGDTCVRSPQKKRKHTTSCGFWAYG